jgi:hypothetical protein
MKLDRLEAQNTPVSDLKPVQGMPLTFLDLSGARGVTDLQPLEGMPLEYLNLAGLPVSDLAVLKSMRSLQRLVLHNIPLSDLTPLEGLRLKELGIPGTAVSDLSPLKHMSLDYIRLTPRNITQGLDILRDMKSLKRISTKDGEYWPPAEFWARYDKGEFK